ncbi:MAG: HAMP domain-containing histidine kinase [Myxococcales bacterium]|nr:HAMP domain-containing histidine kinase [Myxococcales bacterium]MCB9646001.1 HAMP domain-containing histidine kinase [Deltaproteobacteria bacterium]
MDWTPSRDAIFTAEVGRLTIVLRRIRAIGLSIGLAVLVLWFGGPRGAWGPVTAIVVLVGVLPVILADVYRLWRVPRPSTADTAVDLLLGVLGQAAVVTMTGGIESPLLFVFIALALASGASQPGRPGLGLLALVFLAPWGMVLLGHLDLTPRIVPQLLSLEPGFAHQLPYAMTRAAVVNVASVLLFRMGRLLARTVHRMLDEAIEARRGALDTQLARNRELVALSSAIAHELKNPLASVKGLVQLVERGGKNAEKRFEVLNREIDRTRGILDEFLNFSRPLGDLTLKQVDLPELLAGLTALHEGLAEERQVTLTPPPTTPMTLRADPRKLEQALINLMHNALEASRPGQRVTWVLEQADGTVTLGVRDWGPGMAEDILARACQVGATTKAGGSGIGLAVARTIAEQHGGQLLIENLEDGGCRVALALPAGGPPVAGELAS